VAKDDAADRLRRLRKMPNFAPVWSVHADRDRLPQYSQEFGLDKLSCERILRAGSIFKSEMNITTGRDNVHVRGTIDGMTVDIVVDPQTHDGVEVVVVVTLKPKG
jgi:hypothetical protein